MWLHKHGVYYFVDRLEAFLKKIRENSGFKKELFSIIDELNDHLINIEKHLLSYDNYLLKAIQTIHEQSHKLKILKMEKIDEGESLLYNRFIDLKEEYTLLKQDVNKILNNRTEGTNSLLYETVYDIVTKLKEITTHSQDFGKILRSALREIDNYEDWLRNELKSADWVKDNIKSWMVE